MVLQLLLLSLTTSCRAFATWGPRTPPSLISQKMAIDDECVKTSEILSLESIRSTLIRQEETIIFALIERAQFRQNAVVYKKGGFGDLGCPLGSKEVDEQLSFLEYMLMGTVSFYMKFSHWVLSDVLIFNTPYADLTHFRRKHFIVECDAILLLKRPPSSLIDCQMGQ